MKNSVFKNIRILFGHFTSREKWGLMWLVMFSLLMTGFELFTIGAVIPFVGVLVSPEKVLGIPELVGLFEYLGIHDSADLLLPMVSIFGLLAISSALIRLFYIYLNSRFSFSVGARLSTKMLNNVLNLDYETFLKANSSEYLNTISNKTNYLMSGIILGGIQIIGNSIVVFSITTSLIIYNPILSSALFGSLSIIYIVIALASRKYLSGFSQDLSQMSNLSIKVLQESLFAFRDIKISNGAELYSKNFKTYDKQYRIAQALSILVTQAPRYIIEGFALLGFSIAIYMYSGTKDFDLIELLPFIAALALSAQRLLPLAQQLYAALSNLKVYKEPFQDCMDLLSIAPKEENVNRVEFSEKITFDSVGFRYSGCDSYALEKVTISIEKGDKIGIVGETGSGKSTFIDLLMGLLSPTNGKIHIDDQELDCGTATSWYQKIAHVSQSIFLLDASIKENIISSDLTKPFDADLFSDILSVARISEFLDKTEGGINTIVGEKGAKLSGGQIQRIGIARALYKNADVLVFDEATSALDGPTEALIIRNIETYFPEVTLLHIAHRTNSLANCNKILRFESGCLLNVCQHSDL
jgi:ABC-type multidrug transport system fused ATPase/permease subunit